MVIVNSGEVMCPVAVVVVDERVDQLRAFVAADRLLVADRAGGRARAGERAGRRPAVAVGGAFEVGEHVAGRRRGVDGRGVVRVLAAADEEVQVRRVIVKVGEVSVPVPRSSPWKLLARPLPRYPETPPWGGTLPCAGPAPNALPVVVQPS